MRKTNFGQMSGGGQISWGRDAEQPCARCQIPVCDIGQQPTGLQLGLEPSWSTEVALVTSVAKSSGQTPVFARCTTGGLSTGPVTCVSTSHVPQQPSR